VDLQIIGIALNVSILITTIYIAFSISKLSQKSHSVEKGYNKFYSSTTIQHRENTTYTPPYQGSGLSLKDYVDPYLKRDKIDE